LARIARAVHYAHGRGVLHRDLKPSNILVDEDGKPYVTDFGLAKFADADNDLTRATAMMGTPRYMSPEQCRGDNARVSTASDIFSLGVILYEMLAGRPPFEGDSTLDVIRKVSEEPPPALKLPGRDRDLATICYKCLEKEPDQRYSSALALAEDLERFERGEPIEARPVGAIESSWKWAKRKPALASLAAVAFLALLA
jgi:serine/threonine protein kinase